MFLLRIKPMHIILPVLSLAAAYGLGYLLLLRSGGCISEYTVLSGETPVAGFLTGFFITVMPAVLVLFLSITVYASPVALLALLFEGIQDSYYIFSLWQFYNSYEAAAPLHILLYALTRAFFSYAYLLLAVMTMAHQASGYDGLLSKKQLWYLSRFTAVGGAMCVCGIFTHILLFYS